MKSRFPVTIKYFGLGAVFVWGVAAIIGSGGGGGGGGGGGVSYTGAATQAQITEDNAVDLAVGTWNATNTGTSVDIFGAVQVTAELQRSPLSLMGIPLIFDDAIRNINIASLAGGAHLGVIQSASKTIYGACNVDNTVAGGAVISGTVDDVSGAFTVTVSFDDYCEYEQGGGVIINGAANLSGVLDPATLENVLPDFFNYTVTFTTLSLDYLGTNDGITINGSFSANWAASPMLVSMSFVLKDKSSMATYWFKDVQVSLEEGAGYTDITDMTGRYYEPVFGYVDISIGNTVHINDVDNWPSSGSLILTGAQGTKDRLTFLSSARFQVDADTTGDGVYNYTEGPYSWLGYLDPYIFSENASFVGLSSGYVSYYHMKTQVKAESAAESIYIQNNTINEPIPYSPFLDLLSAPDFTYMKRFGPIPPYNPPGVAWEGMNHTFFIDKFSNGVLDADEAFATCSVPVGAFSQMDIPVVSVTGSNLPTISWQPVSGAAIYLVNLFELTAENTLGNLVFSVKVADDGSPSYSYTYNGDLFDSYPMLAIMLVAKDNDSSCYYNRSVFVTTHGK